MRNPFKRPLPQPVQITDHIEACEWCGTGPCAETCRAERYHTSNQIGR